MKYDKGAGLLHRSDHNQYKFPVRNCIPYTQGLPVPQKTDSVTSFEARGKHLK